MSDLKKKIGLSSAQRELARSEDVFPGSALNTISVGMFFKSFGADKVVSACNKVFKSADVFGAALGKEGLDYFFIPVRSHSKRVRSASSGRGMTPTSIYIS